MVVSQACHSAYDVVDEEAVYNCTGNPHPADIEEIVDSMMNEEFQTSFNRECHIIITILLKKEKSNS